MTQNAPVMHLSGTTPSRARNNALFVPVPSTSGTAPVTLIVARLCCLRMQGSDEEMHGGRRDGVLTSQWEEEKMARAGMALRAGAHNEGSVGLEA